MQVASVLRRASHGSQHMRQLASTSTGKLRQVEAGNRLALAGDQRHRLAAEARKALGQRRLVGEGRDDAEAVLPRDVGRREDADDAGMLAAR